MNYGACTLCGREFFGGDSTEQVRPLAADERFCEACAVAACEMVDDIAVQAVLVIPGWISIPQVEYRQMLRRFERVSKRFHVG